LSNITGLDAAAQNINKGLVFVAAAYKHYRAQHNACLQYMVVKASSS
jgi:hypothetical protein